MSRLVRNMPSARRVFVRALASGLGITCLMLLPAASGAATKRLVTVTLKDSTRIQGELLQLEPASVTIDPEGPVSFRVISSAEAVSVYVAALDETFVFPIAPEAIPRVLAKRQEPRMPSARGFRPVALFMSNGVAGAGLGDDEKDYYEGYSTGGAVHVGMRLHFPNHDPRQARRFVGVSYQRSALKSAGNMHLGWDSRGYPVYLVLEPLHVSHYVLDLGLTTPALGSDSYLYLVVGLGYMAHSGAGRLEVWDSNGNVVEGSSTAVLKQGQGAVRLGGGGVIGFSARWGLLLEGKIDLLYAGLQRNYYGQVSPASNGAVPSATVGLLFDI